MKLAFSFLTINTSKVCSNDAFFIKAQRTFQYPSHSIHIPQIPGVEENHGTQPKIFLDFTKHLRTKIMLKLKRCLQCVHTFLANGKIIFFLVLDISGRWLEILTKNFKGNCCFFRLEVTEYQLVVLKK